MKYLPWLVLAALLLCYDAQGADGYFKYGLGFRDELNPKIKTFSLGAQFAPDSIIKPQLEAGMYTDVQKGHRSSGFASASIGIVPRSEHFYAEGFWGPAYITTPDSELSGHFQFKHDLGAGFIGSDETRVGLGYTHVSNAGLKLPNHGRDFLTLRLSVRF